MHIYARQGDMVISETKRPSKAELEKWEHKVDLVVSGLGSGHTHTVIGACKFMRAGRVTKVCVSGDTRIAHAKPDGHKDVALASGAYDIYPLRESRDGLTDQDVVD